MVTKLNAIAPMESPYIFSYWCLIVTYGLTQLVQQICLWNLSELGRSFVSTFSDLFFKVAKGQMWWCYWTLHTWFPIDIYSNRMSISRHFALIASRNVLSYLLIFGLNYEIWQMHQMTPKWPWALQYQRYAIYILLVPTSPKFHSVSLYDRSFSTQLRF